VAGQQLEAGRDPTEDDPAQPPPLQGQVAEQQDQGHPGDHLKLVEQDDVAEGDRAEAEGQPGQHRPGPAGPQGEPAVGPHEQPGHRDMQGGHHLQGGRGLQQPERQVAGIQHGVLEVGQERLAAVLVVQPGGQEPRAQLGGQAVLLGAEEPQQDVVVEGLPGRPQRRQEPDREGLEHQVDDQPLQDQGAARRSSSVVDPGNRRIGGRQGRSAGKVTLHTELQG
jgi:hypothetical protein